MTKTTQIYEELKPSKSHAIAWFFCVIESCVKSDGV